MQQEFVTHTLPAAKSLLIGMRPLMTGSKSRLRLQLGEPVRSHYRGARDLLVLIQPVQEPNLSLKPATVVTCGQDEDSVACFESKVSAFTRDDDFCESFLENLIIINSTKIHCGDDDYPQDSESYRFRRLFWLEEADPISLPERPYFLNGHEI